MGEDKFQTTQTDKLTDGLVGMWSFDGPDVSGVTAYDRSGNNNHGTISGATPVMGKKGQGMGFDGNDNIECGDIDVEGTITIQSWINLGAVSGYQTIVGKRSSSVGNYLLRLNSDEIEFIFWNTGTEKQWRTSVANLQSNNWYHITVEYADNEANPIIYVNGASQGGSWTVGGPSTMQLNDLPTRIGAFGFAPTQYFNGAIDEVRIYSRTLSEDEINDSYGMGQVKIKQ